MNEYPYEAWAEEHFVVYARYGVEYVIQCPNPDHEDSHPSASFNVESGKYFCHSCGYKGVVGEDEISDIQLQINLIKHRLKKLEVETPETIFQPEDMLLRYSVPNDYWNLRKITPETQEQFQLGYDIIASAATIPERDIEGRLYGVTRRFTDPNHIGSRYKYPKGFKASENLFASWLSEEYDFSTVSLHEGAIDAMRLFQLGIPATALYGSNITENHIDLLLKMGVKKVVYFGDSDKAGARAKQRARGFWVRPDDTYVYKKETDLSKHFLLMHVTDYSGKKDAGDMTDQQIIKAWNSKELYTFSGPTKRKKFFVEPKFRMSVLR